MYAPEVLSTFDALARTGCVEFLGETYYHSLSFLYSRNEFAAQINKHTKKIEELFGQTPKVFRNTELIYNNELAQMIESMGRFDAIISEGADHILGYRSPNLFTVRKDAVSFVCCLKIIGSAMTIAFRFSNRDWAQWPLTADKFGHWVSKVNGTVLWLTCLWTTRHWGAPVEGHRDIRVYASSAG